MNSLELIDKKEQLEKEYLAVITSAEKEARKLNEGENADIERIKEEIKNVDEELRKIEDSSKNKTNKTHSTMEKKEFRLLNAINDIANNRQLSEEAQAVVAQGVAEMRKSGQSYAGQIVLPTEFRGDNIIAGASADGGVTVATQKMNILEPLKANLVMTQAGAEFLTNLTGDVSIPSYTGSQVGWAGEVDTASNGKGTFADITLSPKRLTAFIDVSKQFLIQDSVGAEEMLMRQIVSAISNKLEATILSADAGSTTKPAGMLNGVTADAAAVNYAGIVGMETALENANVNGNIKYIVSPSAKADLKTTLKATGVAGYLLEDNELNGYPVLCTSAVAGKGVIMGDFSQYCIGQWGGIDLTVDPFSQATNGKVRIVINAYFDAKPLRTECFAKKVLKA